MPQVVDGKTYYPAKEAAESVGIARDFFYRNVRNRLPPLHYEVYMRERFFVKPISTGAYESNKNYHISLMKADQQ